MNQVVLPLDLERKLQENDIAYAVNNVVENIPTKLSLVFCVKPAVLPTIRG